jgi:IS30 family transposase
MTYDNGVEMAHIKSLPNRPVYLFILQIHMFPRKEEPTKTLIRRYFPKGTYLRT